ncbi:MAG: 7-carboxy-7-deazaguanine synthase QueE [Chitinophagia bacterium]
METISQSSTSLPVMETFYSLQGEGFHQGRAAFFIRLGGCDVGCVWCDVKDSWDASLHPLRTIKSLVEEAHNYPSPLVIITGGEPLLHPLETLTTELKAIGKQVHLETSGSSPLSGNFDWICISPKKFKAALPEVLAKANECKVVVFNRHDLEWAISFIPQLSPDCFLYLQPEWDQREKVTPLIISFIQNNPNWRLSLQIHKYLHID